MAENDAQGEWALPDGWVQAPVSEIYDIIGGGTPSTKIEEYWQGDIPWISSADIHSPRDIRPRRGITKSAIENSATNLVPAGSLIVVTRVGLGKVALADTSICFSQDSQALVGSSDFVLPDYAIYYLSQAVQVFKYRSRGTTIAGVTKKQLADLPFALPPLPEQRRIVAEIETQCTRLDAAVAGLERAQANIRRYKAAVLKAACKGQLVPTEAELARAEGRDYEPADQLLARILAERRAKWEEEHPGKKYKEPAPPDEESLPDVPEGWMWTNFDQITDMVSGKAFKKAEYSESGARLLQIANVAFGQIIWESQTYLPLDYLEKYPNLVLKAGDMLMALNRPILGGQLKVGVLGKRDTPAILYQRVGRFDFYHTPVKPYFFWYAQSPLFVRQLENSLQGVDQPFVTKTRLMGMVVPLPPLAEQRRIVAEVERRLSLVAALEASVEAALARAGRLRQAVLKQAFEGRLVPQDPDDEPASALLERIRAEKAQRQAEGKRTGNRKKPKAEESQQLRMF